MEHEVLQQVLIATYWLDPGHSGPPCTAVIRFTGHRAGVTGALSPKDRFEQVETVEGLIPGSGPVAITTKVQGITAGKWLVRAVLVSQHSESRRVRPWTGQAGARGIWSSDGHVGARRLPAQQLESLTCLLIGAAALLTVLRAGRSADGAVFIGAMATYTLMRQGLLGLRAEPRRWLLARPVTLTAAAVALTADILTWVPK